MLDIGAFELLIVAALTLVVLGPEELPKVLRTITGAIRKVKGVAREFQSGVEEFTRETEIDQFADLRKIEGVDLGMSPDEITKTIMDNRKAEAAEADAEAKDGEDVTGDTAKSVDAPVSEPVEIAKLEAKKDTSDDK